MLNRLLKKAFLFLSFLGLLSCVGEVQTINEDVAYSSKDNPEVNISFVGLHEAIPISDTKIEVYFFPATGGSQKFSYQIYLGNQPDPINASEDVLEKDYRGLYRYTLNDLEIGTKYSIKVDVKDLGKDYIKSTTKSESVYTFSNYVADFSGISTVEVGQGVQGVDSIKVRWAHAAVPGGIFHNGEKPQNYEIIIIDSTKLTPAAFDDETLQPEEGRVVKTIQYDPLITESIVRGLKENTLFYVGVRCVHEGSVEDPAKSYLRGEKNHRYLEIKTLSRDASEIKYNDSDFTVQPNAGSLGTSSFVAQWGEIQGLFDHYRVYYAKKPNLTLDTSNCIIGGGDDLLSGNTYCKKVSPEGFSTTVGDLPPQTDYDVKLLVCLDVYCSDYISLTPRTVKTTANLASFTGIQEVRLAGSVSELGSVKLIYPAVNFESGHFDGLAIEFTDQQTNLIAYINGDGPKPTTYQVSESNTPGHDLRHLYFDYDSDSSVTVVGLDYTAEKSYCFSIYPFNYDPSAGDGKVYYDENSVWRCAKVEPIAPKKTEFAGIASAYAKDNQVVLNWTPPSNGVYTHFEVFMKKVGFSGDTSFDFNQAIEDTSVNFDYTNYDRWLLSADDGVDSGGNSIVLNNYNILGLPNGSYLLGVLTYYNAGIANIKRSEVNQSIYRCTIDGTPGIVECDEI